MSETCMHMRVCRCERRAAVCACRRRAYVCVLVSYTRAARVAVRLPMCARALAAGRPRLGSNATETQRSTHPCMRACVLACMRVCARAVMCAWERRRSALAEHHTERVRTSASARSFAVLRRRTQTRSAEKRGLHTCTESRPPSEPEARSLSAARRSMRHSSTSPSTMRWRVCCRSRASCRAASA